MFVEMMSYIIENSQDFTTALGEHLQLTLIALGISLALGLSLGIIGSRFLGLRNFLLNAAKIGRTIPSLAVLALSLPLLGIGKPPTLLALTLIGTLPILINTIVGLEQVNKDTKEAAVAMGMKNLQILRQLELPLALPVIMAGIRTAAVVIVAGATLAGFIGGGGLGDLILNGHQLGRDHVMLAGALPATLLSFYFEEAFGRLENCATPKGLTDETRQSGGLIGLLLAIAVMPLLFGTLLPWSIMSNAGEASTVLTGIHPEYRGIGLPILVLGLVATLWPRHGEKGNSWPITLVTWGAAIAALLWFIVGLLSKIDALETSGLVLLTVSVISITAVTSIELVLSYRQHRIRFRRIKPLRGSY